jgi:hypothetical protein
LDLSEIAVAEDPWVQLQRHHQVVCFVIFLAMMMVRARRLFVFLSINPLAGRSRNRGRFFLVASLWPVHRDDLIAFSQAIRDRVKLNIRNEADRDARICAHESAIFFG